MSFTPSPDAKNRASAAGSARPRLLFVTRHTPLPWEDGAGAYLHDLARHLAGHGFHVDVLWLAPPEHLRWQKCWRLPDAFDASVRLRLAGAIRLGRRYFFPGMIWYPFKARALHRVRQLLTAARLLAPRPPSPPAAAPAGRPWMSPPTPDEFELVEKCVRSLRPAVVIVNYPWLCPVFQLPALRGVRRACLTPDVAWQRARSVGTAVGVPPAITRDDEVAWLQSAGTIIAIAEADAAEFRRLAPTTQVLVAPKACAGPAAIPAGPAVPSRRLLFVGSGNAFNAEGLGWFLQEVWPLLQSDVPGIRLDVCGSIAGAVPLRPADVVFHGGVPDLAPFYRAASVVIVPLLHASGLNIKLVDAAAAGRAIVASAVTLTGAPFLRDAVHRADTAAGFAAAVRLLLTDAAANAAAAHAAQAAVQRHLSPAACYGALVAHLRSAA